MGQSCRPRGSGKRRGSMKKIAGFLFLALTLAAQQTPPPAGGAPPQGGRGPGGPGGRGPGGRGGGGFGQVAPLEESGFRPIFDGKTLASGDGRSTFGWDCDP